MKMPLDSDNSIIKSLEEKIDFRLKVEKTIGDISTYLVFSSNFEMALKYYLSEIADLFHLYMVDGVLVCLFDEPINDEIMVLGWNSDRISNRDDYFSTFPIHDFSWFQNEIREGHEILLSGTTRLPSSVREERRYIQEKGIQNLIGFPIFTPEYLAGGLFILNITSSHTWQEEDLRSTRIFADILGTAIFRKKTEETKRFSSISSSEENSRSPERKTTNRINTKHYN